MENTGKSSINWYPGHMTKTKRVIEKDIKNVDVVCEIIDARIPFSSRNPDIDGLIANKIRIMVINKSDLADENENKKWLEYYQKKGYFVMLADSKNQKTAQKFLSLIKTACEPITTRRQERGVGGMAIKVMMLGVPNVGKSTFINCISGSKRVKAEDRPGVTRGKQWISAGGIEMLDMPGILWPKIESERQGVVLSLTGAIKDQINDMEYLAMQLVNILNTEYYGALNARYKLPDTTGLGGFELLELISKKRGFLLSGGVVDTERGSKIIIDEYRDSKIGRFTLESPENI